MAEGGARSFCVRPRDIPHGFRVDGKDPAKLVILAMPGGFERFVVEVSEPARTAALPPPSQPDMQKLLNVAAKYKIEILGPLPEQHTTPGYSVP